jgi:hypothetical protein
MPEKNRATRGFEGRQDGRYWTDGVPENTGRTRKMTAIPHLEGNGGESFLEESGGNRVYTRRRVLDCKVGCPGGSSPGRNGTLR